jgi:hypothetical protein
MQNFCDQVTFVSNQLNTLYLFVLVPFYLTSVLPFLQKLHNFLFVLLFEVIDIFSLLLKNAISYLKNLSKQEKNEIIFVVKSFAFLEFCWMLFVG